MNGKYPSHGPGGSTSGKSPSTSTGCTLEFLEEGEYESRYGRESPLLILTIQKQEDITDIRHRVDDFLKNRLTNWQDPARNRILVGLSEAVTNVVKYTPEGWVLVFLDEKGPRFHVIDRGPGLFYSCLPCTLFQKGYSTSGSLGSGFTVMMEYFARILVCTSPRGTKLILCSDLGQQSKEGK